MKYCPRGRRTRETRNFSIPRLSLHTLPRRWPWKLRTGRWFFTASDSCIKALTENSSATPCRGQTRLPSRPLLNSLLHLRFQILNSESVLLSLFLQKKKRSRVGRRHTLLSNHFSMFFWLQYMYLKKIILDRL